MRAVSYLGPSRLRVVEKPRPVVEHAGDAVVRVTRTAICGSDLHLYHGLVPDTRVGCTFGHEFTGVVEEVGGEVQSLRPGDRVVVPFNIACGACFFCERGLTANCERSNPYSDMAGGVYGYSHTTGGYEGGQAQYVRVPFADVGPMKIPDGLADEEVLFLSDILPTGYQAAEMGQIQPGETVAVFGCGPVGLFAQKSAWLLGAGRVIAVDHVDYRLDFARRYSNAEPVDFRIVDDVVQHLRDMTDGRGPDVCIDAVGLEASGSLIHRTLGGLGLQAGAATALSWAIDAVRKGGNVSIIGVYGPPWNLVPIGTAMNKGLTLRMNQCNVKRYMPRLARRWSAQAGLRRPLRPSPRTLVFGTAQPPHGLSGLVRRTAYRIPEHRARRWALLLLADRLDILENAPGTRLPLMLGVIGGVVAVTLMLRRR
jgi:threonine dehydrogenase-like Zn-dependent dehydrogenase